LQHQQCCHLGQCFFLAPELTLELLVLALQLAKGTSGLARGEHGRRAKLLMPLRQLMLEHAMLATPAGPGDVVQCIALLQRHQTLCGHPGRRWAVQCSRCSGHRVGCRAGFLACALQPLP